MTGNGTDKMNERSGKPRRTMTTALKDLIIISAAFILVSVLVYVFGVFEAFQEWARRQTQWNEWRVHDYVFVIEILTVALGIFAVRRWNDCRSEITARTKAEKGLRESEERFRSVADSAINAIVVANGKGNIILWNNAAENIFGYSKEAALGRPLTILMPQRFQDSHRRGMARFLSTGKSSVLGKNVELVGMRKDGSEFPADISLASWKTGEEVFFSGIIRDLTERDRAEKALRESEERFTAFMNNIPVIAWLKDPATWTFRYVNKTFEEIFGITQEAIINKTDFDLWPEEIAKQLRENDLGAMSSDKTIQTSEDVPLPDGTVHHWLVFKFPLHLGSGKSLLAGTAVDITERMRVAEKQKILIHELQSALTNVKTLSGLLPICASCKKIRNDEGYWNQIEGYLMEHTGASFSHSVCPDCARKLYPDYIMK